MPIPLSIHKKSSLFFSVKLWDKAGEFQIIRKWSCLCVLKHRDVARVAEVVL